MQSKRESVLSVLTCVVEESTLLWVNNITHTASHEGRGGVVATLFVPP